MITCMKLARLSTNETMRTSGAVGRFLQTRTGSQWNTYCAVIIDTLGAYHQHEKARITVTTVTQYYGVFVDSPLHTRRVAAA